MEVAQWFYVVDDRQVGPVSAQELGHLFRSRQLHPSTLVWSEGLTGWVMASTIHGLVPVDFASAPPPIPPVGAYSAPSRRARTVTYAGFWRRFAAMIIDTIILTFGGGLLGGIVGAIVGITLAASGSGTDAIQSRSALLGYIIGFVLNWLYFTLLESSARQATPEAPQRGLTARPQ